MSFHCTPTLDKPSWCSSNWGSSGKVSLWWADFLFFSFLFLGWIFNETFTNSKLKPSEPACRSPAWCLHPTLSLSFSKITRSELCCSLQTFKPFYHVLFYSQLCHARQWIFWGHQWCRVIHPTWLWAAFEHFDLFPKPLSVISCSGNTTPPLCISLSSLPLTTLLFGDSQTGTSL